MNRVKMNEFGETIVEVMLATAILSLVLAGAFTLSNRATRLSQNANEHTTVSNLMQREVELLRAKYDSDSGAFWADVDPYSQLDENPDFCNTDSGPSPSPDKSFYVEESGLSLTEAVLADGKVKDFDQNDLFNVWVEAVTPDTASGKYTDFFVYACWEGIGGEGIQNSGLIMRLSR